MNKNYELLTSIQRKIDILVSNGANPTVTSENSPEVLQLKQMNRLNTEFVQAQGTILSDGSDNYNQDFTGVNNDFAVVQNTTGTDIYMEYIQFSYVSTDGIPNSLKLFGVLPTQNARLVLLNSLGNIDSVVLPHVGSFKEFLCSGFELYNVNVVNATRHVSLRKTFQTPVKIPDGFYIAFELKENFLLAQIDPMCVEYFFFS